MWCFKPKYASFWFFQSVNLMLATQAPWIIICFQYRDLYFYIDASILKHTAANTINRRDNITV